VAGFDDLIYGIGGSSPAPMIGYTWKRKLGTSWRFGVANLQDADGANIDLSTGFTAAATFRTRNSRGDVVASCTNTSSGLSIDLAHDPGHVQIVATPGGTAAFAGYSDLMLMFDLVVTRASDGAKVSILSDCWFIPATSAIEGA